MKTALLAGGPADIGRETAAHLMTRNLLIVAHWEWNRPRVFNRPIPRVDLVIVLIDMIGHKEQNAVIASARRAGVPFIRTVRKRSTMDLQLAARGLMQEQTGITAEQIDAWTAEPPAPGEFKDD